MPSKTPKERAKLLKTDVLDARSLETSHKRLAEVLKPGMIVLDVGCGTGAITCGMAKVVGPMGRVVGIDNSPELIKKAQENYKDVPGLSFQVGDIYDLPFSNEFDIVTSARVLQWLSDPQTALENMVKSTKTNGRVLVLDYNHEKIKWKPEVPESMIFFYHVFLRWRADAGMDNTIADNLVDMFKKANLRDIKVTLQHEKAEYTNDDFNTHITIWASVVDIKGPQMVQDGYLSEKERMGAETDFRRWIKEDAKAQIMYLLSVEGIKSKIIT